MTGDDAWFMVDKYLDDAKRGGLFSVTLIHGKGTGALQQEIYNCYNFFKHKKSATAETVALLLDYLFYLR